MAAGDKESLLSLVFDRAIADRVPSPPKSPEAGAAAPSAVAHLSHCFDPFLGLLAENDGLARAYFRTLARGKDEDASLWARAPSSAFRVNRLGMPAVSLAVLVGSFVRV